MVLDEQHGGLRLVAHDIPDQLAQLGDLVFAQSARRLVEQQQRGARDEGAGERDALLDRVRQIVRMPFGGVADAEAVERVLRPGRRLGEVTRARLDRPSSPTAMPGAPDERPAITFCRTVRPGNSASPWNVRATPGGGEPVGTRTRTAVDEHRARLRPREPADDVEHRGLAGTVRADEAHDLALCDVERHLVECGQPAEARGDLAHAESCVRDAGFGDGHAHSIVSGSSFRSL